MPDEATRKDFFVSYNKADHAWAEWIGWVLEEAEFSVVLQAWDFRPGMDFIGQMDQAAQHTCRTIAVLSPNYLAAKYTHPEWHAAFRRDVQGEKAVLVPVRVRDCGPDFGGLLANLAWIDLLDKDEATARQELLNGLKEGRVKPNTAPAFPGSLPASTSTTLHPGPFPGSAPDYWLMPHARNLFFTGREGVLDKIHLFQARQPHAVLTQAITGLGGVGKSQAAIEYAYRYAHEYQAVFWIQAETREALQGDLLKIASELKLPDSEVQEQPVVLDTLLRWLETHNHWLLILDNVEDQQVVREALPTRGQGHVLLTARDPVLGDLAEPFPLDVLPEEEGITFLIRRARLPTPATAEAITAQREKARAIVGEVGALPLALDQAGAYMEETRIGLADYLALYQMHRKALLARRGRSATDHSDSVATTFVLAFEKVQQTNKAAAKLLEMCAFLAPDAIPEELFTKGAKELSPALRHAVSDPLRWNDTLEVLRRYALLERQPESKTLYVHRLVQAVLKDEMGKATQRRLTEQVVRAVNNAFPSGLLDTWDQCQQLLPHALACADLIEQWEFVFDTAALLLNQTAYYLKERGQYAAAFPLLERALALYKQPHNYDSYKVTTVMHNLAEIYSLLGQNAQALSLIEVVLATRVRELGSDHPLVIVALNNKATIYLAQGADEEALPLLKQILAISERVLGPTHLDVATYLNNMALLLEKKGRLVEAETLLHRTKRIREQHLGPDHPIMADTLSNLATNYAQQKRLNKAIPLAIRALAISEQTLGKNHPGVAAKLNNLAGYYFIKEEYEQAALLYKRALLIMEEALPSHPKTISYLESLAIALRKMGKVTEASKYITRAAEIRAKRASS